MTLYDTRSASPLVDLLFQGDLSARCLVAPDGTVLRANDVWLRSTVFSPDDVLGANIIDLFPGTRDMALSMHARARAGHRVQVPCHAQIVNERETWWEGSIDPVAMDGGTGLLITAREVKERKEEDRAAAESRARSEILELGDAFIELDSEYRVVRVNARQDRLTGISRAQAIGKSHWELWPATADPDSEVRRQYHRCMERRVPVVSENYYAPLDLWSSVTAYPTTTGGIAIFFRDVNDRHRAEADLRASNERARWWRGTTTRRPSGSQCPESRGAAGRARGARARVQRRGLPPHPPRRRRRPPDEGNRSDGARGSLRERVPSRP